MNARSIIGIAAAIALLAGILGVGPVAAETPSVSEATGVPYIVHPGDTLSRIAAGHGVTISSIVTANKIRNRNFIYVGQRLTIPDPSPQVIVDSPSATQQATLASPITVKGQANAFEGAVLVQVRDRYWRVVGSGQGLAAMGEYKPFTITVPYTVTATQVGYVDVYSTSGRDGSKVDMVTVKVTLQAVGTPACRVNYTVKWGDTLSKIARAQDSTVGAIASASGLRNVNFILPGQKLCIP